MNISFNKNEITDAQILMLAQVINSAKSGGFMSVKGFRSKSGNGEIQDTIYCKGINYENAQKKSLKMLEEIERNPEYTLTVKRGTWNNAEGETSPTGRKSKDYCNFQVVTETYKRGDSEMEDAIASIRKSLTDPAPVTKEYQEIGNGVYKDESGKVYVRDLRLVSKKVIVEGEKKQSASGAKVAIQDAIKSHMPIGNYRMFNLDGDYDKIVLGGVEIAQEAGIHGEVEIPVEELENA
jgi:hypothetical protein